VDGTNFHSNTLQNLLEAYLPQTLGVGHAEQVVLALQNLMAMDSVRHVDHIAALTSLLIEHLAPMDGLRCACQKSPAKEPCDTQQERHAKTDAYLRAEGLAASVSRCLATAIKNTANPLATLSILSHRCMRHTYSKHVGSRLQACSLMLDLLEAATTAGSGTPPHACDEPVPERAVVAVCVFFLPRLADPQLQIARIACRALQVRSRVMLNMK
jgi:hypothetical protein